MSTRVAPAIRLGSWLGTSIASAAISTGERRAATSIPLSVTRGIGTGGAVATEASPSTGRWLGAAAMLAAGFAVLRLSPNWGLPCLFKSLTSYACPGCGSTRALRALAHFDVVSALALNPLLTLATLGFGGWVLIQAAEGLTGWRSPRPRPSIGVLT